MKYLGRRIHPAVRLQERSVGQLGSITVDHVIDIPPVP